MGKILLRHTHRLQRRLPIDHCRSRVELPHEFCSTVFARHPIPQTTCGANAPRWRHRFQSAKRNELISWIARTRAWDLRMEQSKSSASMVFIKLFSRVFAPESDQSFPKTQQRIVQRRRGNGRRSQEERRVYAGELID